MAAIIDAVFTKSSMPHLVPVNVLTMYFSTGSANHRYLKLFVVAQAVVAKMLRELFAVFDRFQIGIKLNTDAIPHRNAIFHIKEEQRHIKLSYIIDARRLFESTCRDPAPWHEQQL
jgi:hypothetical protein